jgi:hypothetical protein
MASTRNRTGNLFRPPRRGDTALAVATRWYDPAVIVATIDGVVDAANVDTLSTWCWTGPCCAAR